MTSLDIANFVVDELETLQSVSDYHLNISYKRAAFICKYDARPVEVTVMRFEENELRIEHTIAARQIRKFFDSILKNKFDITAEHTAYVKRICKRLDNASDTMNNEQIIGVLMSSLQDLDNDLSSYYTASSSVDYKYEEFKDLLIAEIELYISLLNDADMVFAKYREMANNAKLFAKINAL